MHNDYKILAILMFKSNCKAWTAKPSAFTKKRLPLSTKIWMLGSCGILQLLNLSYNKMCQVILVKISRKAQGSNGQSVIFRAIRWKGRFNSNSTWVASKNNLRCHKDNYRNLTWDNHRCLRYSQIKPNPKLQDSSLLRTKTKISR